VLDRFKALLLGGDHAHRLTEEHPEPDVAVCALLLEAAEADQDFAPEERWLIVEQLRRRFALDRPQVEALIAETQRRRAAAADLWPFTHAIRKAYSPEQKQELLVLVWQVLLADQHLDAREEQWAGRLTEMLAVNHSLLMEAKRLARQSMSGGGLGPKDPVPQPG
jgi:uncharacterized tellurite resistance protein B-like protein